MGRAGRTSKRRPRRQPKAPKETSKSHAIGMHQEAAAYQGVADRRDSQAMAGMVPTEMEMETEMVTEVHLTGPTTTKGPPAMVARLPAEALGRDQAAETGPQAEALGWDQVVETGPQSADQWRI